MREEKPETKDASEQDRHSKPCAIEEFIEHPAIGSDYTLDKIARVPFHPGPLMASPALTQNASAHQRRERQRHKARGENGHNDRDRKFAENPAKQPGNENQRNENRGKRKRHRQDCKRDFARAVESGF